MTETENEDLDQAACTSLLLDQSLLWHLTQTFFWFDLVPNKVLIKNCADAHVLAFSYAKAKERAF